MGAMLGLLMVTLVIVAAVAPVNAEEKASAPRSGTILVLQDDEALTATQKIVERYRRPAVATRKTESANRIFFTDENGQLILNTTAKGMMAKLGDPAGGLWFEVDNPAAEARRAAEELRSKGFKVEILIDLEPEAPKGALVFLKSDALNKWVMLFRWPKEKLTPPKPADKK